MGLLLKNFRDNSILSKTSLIAWIQFNLSNECRFTFYKLMKVWCSVVGEFNRDTDKGQIATVKGLQSSVIMTLSQCSDEGIKFKLETPPS